VAKGRVFAYHARGPGSLVPQAKMNKKQKTQSTKSIFLIAFGNLSKSKTLAYMKILPY
jgi:hypothetical protein